MTDTRLALPQGTLDLLILRTLAPGAQHGWAMAERIQQMSSDVLQIPKGRSILRCAGSNAGAASRRGGVPTKAIGRRTSTS